LPINTPIKSVRMSHDQFAVLFLVTDMLNYFSYLFSLLSYSHVSCQNTWHRLQQMKKKKEKKYIDYSTWYNLHIAYCAFLLLTIASKITKW